MPQPVQHLGKPEPEARPAPQRKGASGLVLPVVSILCCVLGLVLLIVGVFVLQDPQPQPVNNAAAEQVVGNPEVNVPLPQDLAQSQGTSDPASVSEETLPDAEAPSESLPEEGTEGTSDVTQPEEGFQEDPAATEDPAAAEEPAAEEPVAAEPQSLEGEMRITHGKGETVSPEEDGTQTVTEEGTPSEETLPAEEPQTLPEEGGDSAMTVPQEETQTAPESSALESTVPAQETQPQTTVQQPLPEEEEADPEINLVKWILSIVGLLLLVVGAALGIINGFVQRQALARKEKQLAAALEQLQAYEFKHRDPTYEEKLRFVLQQIPALERAPAQPKPGPAPRPADASAQAGRQPRQAPVQQDPQTLGDAAYAARLASGSQQGALDIVNDSHFEGATIDINTCLNGYRAGQEVPYHLNKADKGIGTPYFGYVYGNRVLLLYPNPYVVEKLGLAQLENQQYILKAFRVVTPNGEVTPQNAGMAHGLHVRRVRGAVLNEQMVVVQMGQIELG